jgi:hypothetical protein
MAGASIYKESLPVNRRKCVLDKLKLKAALGAASVSVQYSASADAKEKSTASVTLEQLAPVLNDVCQLEFPETDSN